ncbi:hypothetical protein BRADI_4g21637v3 [Brachypodium distachyon]|uniref:Serine carboxypeptidase-like 19 n=1 Tax=Brachypodium distachyon TaxID=15368 RepID=A0A2K2CP67_BRADI|nr:hypothetical protein BRADI_4g21637v3 [Brachypodium distachyon]
MEMEVQASLPQRLLRFVLLLCFSSLCYRFVSSADSAPTPVSRLPGFDGDLHSTSRQGRYVSVEEENGAELFYYFIESEGDPRRDPVLLWLTGGDRCSVLSGLFFEIGPLKFVVEPYNEGSIPRLRYHPYSWAKFASILFVIRRSWFTEHQDYLANPFYVGGDSIAARIVPFLALKISEDIEAGRRPTINLKVR